MHPLAYLGDVREYSLFVTVAHNGGWWDCVALAGRGEHGWVGGV